MYSTKLKLNVSPKFPSLWSHPKVAQGPSKPSMGESVVHGKLKWEETDNCSQLSVPPCSGLEYTLLRIGILRVWPVREAFSYFIDFGCGH